MTLSGLGGPAEGYDSYTLAQQAFEKSRNGVQAAIGQAANAAPPVFKGLMARFRNPQHVPSNQGLQVEHLGTQGKVVDTVDTGTA